MTQCNFFLEIALTSDRLEASLGTVGRRYQRRGDGYCDVLA